MSLKLHPTSDQTDAKSDAAQGKVCTSADTKAAAEPARKALADDPAEEKPSQAETLDYVMALTIQIKNMAQRAGFRRLGLILMLAEQEARQQIASNGGTSPPAS